jgi:hypothetical protein
MSLMVGDNPMGEEQKKWHQQFSASFGLQEYLRFSCAILIWNFLGVILGLVLEFAGYSMGGFVVAIFVVMMFVFPFTVWSWKPAYSILRLILGKEKLPPELPTRKTPKMSHQPRPWWSFLPSIWWYLWLLLLFYLVIKYYLR